MKFKEYLIESNSTKTQKDKTGHAHMAMVNDNGDGKTTATFPTNIKDHIHNVFQWLVQPSNGHIHNLEE